MMVTGALSEPSTTSPSGPGFANSLASTSGVAALAGLPRRENSGNASPAPASTKAPLVISKWRRVDDKVGSWIKSDSRCRNNVALAGPKAKSPAARAREGACL